MANVISNIYLNNQLHLVPIIDSLSQFPDQLFSFLETVEKT